MKKRHLFSFPAVAVVGLSLGLVLPAHAGEGRRAPPEEAVAACVGLASSDSCGFVTPHGHEIAGSCRSLRDNVSACVPNDHMRKPRGTPRGAGEEQS